MILNKKTLIILIFPLLLSACVQKQEVILEEAPVQQESEDEFVVGDRLTVPRGLVAKMVALTYNDLPSVNAMDREINFNDTSKDDWYDKYINTVRVQKYMLGEEDMFHPDSPLTIEQAQTLLDRFDKNNKLKIKVTEETKNKPISYALWIELYKSMIENVSENKVKETFNIEEKEIIVLASPDNNKNLTGYNLISDIGAFGYEGIDISHYLDKKISVLMKNNEIIAVVGILEENPVIKNSYIVKNTEYDITIFAGGVERTYRIDNKSDDNLADKICDIQLFGDNAEIKKVYENAVSGKIKMVTDQIIELENVGIKNVSEEIKIYSTVGGEVFWKSLTDLIVGTDIAYYYMDDDTINAAVITKIQAPEKIRVAISDTGYTSLYHNSVEITSTEEYTVIQGDVTKHYKPNDIYKPALKDDERVIIESENGKLKILSIERNWEGGEAPSYRGILEISKSGDEYIIVNELPFEEYLYAVIPSEMPTSYGLQAAMVQAVTARSYAYNQFYENRFHDYGANIDDSIICQVYNNIPENEISIEAVEKTKSLCITYLGEVISANFFSTSSGYTANSGEVWANTATKQFPSETPTYLTASKQFSEKDFGDLSVEENAAKFFKDSEVDCFEKDFPWFRWNIEMTADEISDSINSTLEERYKANPSLIKTLQPDGYYRTKGISTIGEVTNMQVIKRGEAGNIMQLKISGTEATIMVYTEYNIRMLLAPKKINGDIIINLNGGGIVKNYSMIPSSFFVFDKYIDGDGNLTRIVFYGGGNGHGVGMSQNGVKGMIDQGYDFESIIKHYFSGVELEKKF